MKGNTTDMLTKYSVTNVLRIRPSAVIDDFEVNCWVVFNLLLLYAAAIGKTIMRMDELRTLKCPLPAYKLKLLHV